MNFRNNIAVLGTLALQGCAAEPQMQAKGPDTVRIDAPAGAHPAMRQTPLSGASRERFESLKQVDDAITIVRKRITERSGETTAGNVDFLCQGNREAVQCAYEQATAAMQAAMERSRAMKSCYHPNPDDASTETIDVECFFKALGTDYVPRAMSDRLVACRTEILACYENILQ